MGAQVHHHARRRAPSPRSGASATAVGRKVYVFGGQCPERGTCFNDVVVLDCESWEWSRLPVSGASPPPRNAHVACAAENGRLLVIHGGSSPEEGPMGDVHVLDLEEGAERWVRPTVRGQAPAPRDTAAAAVAAPGANASSRGELLILGGRGRSGVLSDVAVLNLDDMAWTRRGHLGRAVCAHTAVPWRVETAGEDAAANAALVFGGFDDAALRPNELFAVEASTLATVTLHPGDGRRPGRGVGKQTGEVPGSDRGRAPEGRFAHACVALPRTATAPATAVIFAGVTPGGGRTSRTHARGRRRGTDRRPRPRRIWISARVRWWRWRSESRDVKVSAATRILPQRTSRVLRVFVSEETLLDVEVALVERRRGRVTDERAFVVRARDRVLPLALPAAARGGSAESPTPDVTCPTHLSVSATTRRTLSLSSMLSDVKFTRPKSSTNSQRFRVSLPYFLRSSAVPGVAADVDASPPPLPLLDAVSEVTPDPARRRSTPG